MDVSMTETGTQLRDMFIDLSEDHDNVACDSVNQSRKRKHDEIEDFETERKRLNANHQERTRMRKINKALDDLRKVLPSEFSLYHRRMSKIRTLRTAMQYIKNLTEIIIQDNLRRHELGLYNQALQSIHTGQDMVNMSPAPPQTDPTISFSMSPLAAMMPIYPYLTPICMGFDPAQSPYHTPEQVQNRRLANPRHLNFGSTPNPVEMTPRRPSTKPYAETPVKPHKQPSCREINPQCLGQPKKIKSETITSPLLGQRNPTELDASFLSTNSEGPQEEMIEIPPLQTDGRIIPRGRMLAEILTESDEL